MLFITALQLDLWLPSKLRLLFTSGYWLPLTPFSKIALTVVLMRYVS